MQNRIEAIDQYRGIAIILMVIANYLFDVTTIPGWLKHAPDIGLTVIDLIAPFFIFAIGLTYGASYRAQGRAGRGWQDLGAFPAPMAFADRHRGHHLRR